MSFKRALKRFIISASSKVTQAEITAKLRDVHTLPPSAAPVAQPIRSETNASSILDFAACIVETYKDNKSFRNEYSDPKYISGHLNAKGQLIPNVTRVSSTAGREDESHTLFSVPRTDVFMVRFRDDSDTLWEVKYFLHSDFWMCENPAGRVKTFPHNYIISHMVSK